MSGLTPLSLVVAALGGLLAGGFLTVLTWRGPVRWDLVDPPDAADGAGPRRDGGLARPRSYCPACGTQLAGWRALPLIGYLASGARCGACGATVPWRYPAIEIAATAISIAALVRFGAHGEAIFAAVFGWSLLALAVIDLETGYLPDAITAPLLVMGLAVNAADIFTPLPAAIVGAAIGYLVFRGAGAAFEALRGYEGLGLGDAKLLAAIGAWVGWRPLAPTIFLAAVLVLAVMAALALAARGRRESPEAGPFLRREAPFGPGLALAGGIALFAPAGSPFAL